MRNASEFFREIFDGNDIIAESINGEEIGMISKLSDNRIVLIYSLKNIINLEDESKIYDSMIFFEILSDCMNYLRQVRFDHAINYDIKNLSEPLLGELYKNRKVEIKDILSV